ncbi:MAG: hypothetical protein AMXMBFR44_0470 [Candidatus Campbellbacteria bacterium]
MAAENKRIFTFHVNGMHCASCVLLTESELKDTPGVKSAKANLATLSVTVEGDFGDKTPEQVAQELSVPLRPHGYTLLVEKKTHDAKWREFNIAFPVALGLAFLFVLLQKTGLVNLIGGGSVTFGTAFLIGVIASLSTCMAVVGGLVLSMSATFAKSGDRLRPQMLFHVGRLVSFFVLGGVIGAVGSAFTLSGTATFVLGLLIGLVMLILGINLLDTFHWAKKLQPAMPKFIARHAHGISKLNHSLTPLLVGIATFFLPCGFTQSMQIYTLSTGSFLSGGLTMLVYALGTLPVLALLSFSSWNIAKHPSAGIFFKTAGLIVVLFALFNIVNALAVIGVIPPVFSF